MKLLIVSSTLPTHDEDKVPSFVKDQANCLLDNYKNLEITVLAPSSAHSLDSDKKMNTIKYSETRFHYFWPHKWELLTGRGILPSIKQNKILYFQIPFFLVAEFFALLYNAKKIKPDLIYAHWFMPQAINSFIVAKILNIPFVFTTHASDVSVLSRVPFSKFLVRSVCTKASAYTAVSQRTADKLKRFFSEKKWDDYYSKKLSIIPMGVSLEQRNSLDSTKILENFNIPHDKKLILFIGRLAEKKGVRYLLEGYSKISKTLKQSSHLIISGDGQLKTELEVLANDLNIHNVTFTGYVNGDAKEGLFKASCIACFPSIIDSWGDSEGFPVAIMESLSYGKITIASNKTGAEKIITSGKDGYIIKEKSSEDITKYLSKALKLNNNEVVKMQKKAKNLSQNFEINNITKKHAEFFGIK